MQFINIHDAKTNLSKYLNQISKNHETIIICKSGKPIAQLTEYKELKSRKLGLWHNKVKIKNDFDELPTDFKGFFE